MSNISTANDIARPLRRSTRLIQAIPLTVMGVDSYRGPYREDVSTVSISCHGCRYESKHDVLTNSWVMLEIKGEDPNQPSITARGLVKWVQRAIDTGGSFQTAIELEDPGNVWGLQTPPADWMPYSEAKDQEASAARPKPFAVRKGESLAVTDERRASAPVAHEIKPSTPLESMERPIGQLMGNFQRQIEQTLFDAANAAVRERVITAIDEARGDLKQEAKRLVAEAASAQSEMMLNDFVHQLKQASADGARALHAEWTKTIDADLHSAIVRIEEQNRALQLEAESLATSVIGRVQRGLETLRQDAVSRIVERLKEQSAPIVEEAKKATGELQKAKEGWEAMIDQRSQKSSEHLEEICVRLEKQFEIAVGQQMDAVRMELERAAQSATNLALSNLDVIAQHQEAETKTRLRTALEPVADAVLVDLKAKADSTSAQFAEELMNYSRSHLEFVGNAISDFAKGIGKQPKP